MMKQLHPEMKFHIVLHISQYSESTVEMVVVSFISSYVNLFVLLLKRGGKGRGEGCLVFGGNIAQLLVKRSRVQG